MDDLDSILHRLWLECCGQTFLFSELGKLSLGEKDKS